MTTPHLNRRLMLEAQERVADGAGGYAISWVPVGEVWAQVKPRSGRIKTTRSAAVSMLALRIFVRATPVGSPSRPQPQQRFREGTRHYMIEAVSELDAGGRYLICYALEETAV